MIKIYLIRKYWNNSFEKDLIELTDETNFDDLLCYFKCDTARKKIDDFENGVKLLEQIKSDDTSTKLHYEILNCCMKHEELLLSCLMIILQLHLRLNLSNSWKRTFIRLSSHS